MFMTIQSNVKDKILATPSETSKVENAPAEMLRDLDQQMEKRADDAQSEAFKQENALAERLHGLDQQMERKEDENNSKEWNSGDDQLRLRWMIYLVVLADAAESVRDMIGFDYHLSIWCAPFEALYGMKLLIKEKLKAARDRQKSYADNRRKPLEFVVGYRIMLKVSPWKGVIRYVGPFKILERTGHVAYRLRLPEELSGVHDTFHVSNLKKCLADASLHVPLDEIKVDKTLRFVEEPVVIMDREVKSLKRSRILLVSIMRMLRLKEVARKTVGMHLEFAPESQLISQNLLVGFDFSIALLSSITGKENVVTDALSRKERLKPRRVRAMAMTIQTGNDENGSNGCGSCIKIDAAESVSDTIGFEYCLSSSSGWKNFLYGRKFRSPVLWDEIKKVVLDLDPSSTQTVWMFEVGRICVMLKVSPWKGVVRFGKKGKLAPRYVGLFEILKRISPVAYRVRLSEELSGVHDTFHVSNLKKCLVDASLHVPLDEIKVDKTLCFVKEPVEIMDREVKSLKRKWICLKVRWNSKRGPEFTWEREDYMKSKYPQLFVDRADESTN
ncbi:hypothetical protein Tco_0294408 [Tanacetum coccineum]